MATKETPDRGEERGISADTPSIRSGPTTVSQVTENITTNNFINVGQVVRVSGSNNTVIMAGNRVQLVQQNTHSLSGRCTPPQHSQSPHTHHQSHHLSQRTDYPHQSPHVPAAVQSPRVTYAAGPPDAMEILTLTQKLAGALGHNWKLLAVPLSIPDYELASVECDETTLLMRINKLLLKWMDLDESNDRTKLALLLSRVDGFNLGRPCRLSLRTV